MLATRNAVAAAALMLLAACSGQQTRLTAEDRLSLAAQPQIQVVHHALPRTFLVESTGYTAVGMIFSPLVAGAMVAEGMGLQRDLKLEDPAPRAKERLARALEARLQLTNLRMIPQAVESDDLAFLKQRFGSGLVLDVRTAKWGIDNNRAKYSGRARLVRLSDSMVLWQGTCEFVADKERASPEREALVAKEGELLKQKLGEAADGCADQLAQWITAR